MNKPADKKPILVVGGTGKSGRRVAERLKSLGLPIRIGSRTGEPPSPSMPGTPQQPESGKARHD